jgi:hypothetical protein
MAVGWTHTSQSLASSTLTVNARGPTAGTPPTTGPVAIDVHMAVTDTPPPQLHALGVRMPPGFATVLVPSCDANALQAHGSNACATSMLGTGKASAYVPSLGTVTTRELSVFRGTGDSVILYARIDTGIAGIRTVLLSGVLGGRPTDPPLLKFQLDKIGMGAALTSADMTLTQGLQAGPCPTGSWTFRAQLEFVDAPPALTTPSVPCAQTPPPAPSAPLAPSVPSLRASARNGTRASGARLALVLSEPATIKITLQRRADGHWIAVRRLAVRKQAGSTSLTIRTAHERPLRAGRYRARLQAVNAAGAQSTPQTVRFTIRRGGVRRR